MRVGDAMRVFLPVYLTAFLLITYTFAVRSFIRSHGVDPRATRESDAVLYFCQRVRDGIMIAIIVVIGTHALAPGLDWLFAPIPYLGRTPVRGAGALVLVAALTVIRTGQKQLGASWRIGVDRSGAAPGLVERGLFRHTRNPIAVGMFLNASGLFLALPNAVTFAIVWVVLVILQVRIRVEEEHMRTIYGVAYDAYCRRTPRWLWKGRSA